MKNLPAGRWVRESALIFLVMQESRTKRGNWSQLYLLLLLVGLSDPSQADVKPTLRVRMLFEDGSRLPGRPESIRINGEDVSFRIDAEGRLITSRPTERMKVSIHVVGFSGGTQELYCPASEDVCSRVVFFRIAEVNRYEDDWLRRLDFSKKWNPEQILQIRIYHLATGRMYRCQEEGKGVCKIPIRVTGALVAIAVLEDGKIETGHMAIKDLNGLTEWEDSK